MAGGCGTSGIVVTVGVVIVVDGSGFTVIDGGVVDGLHMFLTASMIYSHTILHPKIDEIEKHYS